MSSNDHSDQSGLGLHAPSNWQVKNETGSTLTQLKGVKLDGNDADGRRKVTPISALTDIPLGLVSEGILDDGIGSVIGFDFIVDIDTTVFGAAGTILYLDINGDLTTAMGSPATPNIRIGLVHVEDATNGEIFVTSSQKGETGPAANFRYNVTGGNRNVSANAIIPFSYGHNDAIAGVPALNAGEVFGLTIAQTETRTAGVLTASVLINGVVQNGPGEEIVIDATNPTSNILTLGSPIQFSAGDILSMQTSTVGFAPIGSDSTMTMFLRDT